jgi:actin-related protein
MALNSVLRSNFNIDAKLFLQAYAGTSSRLGTLKRVRLVKKNRKSNRQIAPMSASTHAPGEPQDRVPWRRDTPFVIDLGSDTTRFGLAGERVPRYREPTIHGELRTGQRGGVPEEPQTDRTFVGLEAASRPRRRIILKRPLERGGVISSWEAMEDVLRHPIAKSRTRRGTQAERDLEASGGAVVEKNPLLLTEGIHNPRENREKTAELCFEGLGVAALSLVARPLASLYAQQTLMPASSNSPSMSGLVVSVGESGHTIVPVLNGRARLRQVQMYEFGGRDLTEYMEKILTERGYTFITSAECAIVRDIKEELSYVAQNCDEEMRLASESVEIEQIFELPDGQIITVGSERFRCPEPMFQPALLGMSASGIHKNVSRVVSSCDSDDQAALWGNIVLSGGSTTFSGFSDRLEREVHALLPSVKGRIWPPCALQDQAFVGASLLAASPHFSSMCLSRERWAEEGAEAIHSACPHGDLSVTQGAFVKAARKT